MGISHRLFLPLVLLALVCAPSANAQAASDPGVGLINLDVLVTVSKTTVDGCPMFPRDFLSNLVALANFHAAFLTGNSLFARSSLLERTPQQRN
jgi:hypothetical protein